MTIGLIPYLVFDGKGQEAVQFYADVFQARVLYVHTFGNENPNMPEEAKNRVLHAHLKIGQHDLMISDTIPGEASEIGSNFSLAIMVENVDAAKSVFVKLQQDGGKVDMPLQKTSWSPAYGKVIDKYGVIWQISVQEQGHATT